MKFDIIKKWKLWVIATLVIIVAGLAIFGFMGVNKTLDNSNGCEIQVSVDDNLANAKLVAKDVAEAYFEENLIANKIGSVQEITEYGYIYNFDKVEWKDGASVEDLISKIETAINNDKVNVTVEVREFVVLANSDLVNIIIAVAIATVVAFIYLLIAEKKRAAFTAVISAIIALVLNVALVAIARVPVAINTLFTVVAFLLAFVLSAGMLNRFKENQKLVTAEKREDYEIANLGAKLSVMRFAFVFFALLIASVVIFVLGSVSMQAIALQLLVASVSAVFSAFVYTPIVWNAIK